MNFKKFISGISALTIAASAFAGMAVTANAAVTAFSESYSSTSTATGWSTGTSGRFTPEILNEGDNYFLSVKQDERNNNGTTVTGNVVSGKAAAGDNFTMTFDMRLSSSNNQTNTEFKIMDASNSGTILSLKETGSWATTWIINGTSTQVTLPNSNKANKTDTIADVTWCSYVLTVKDGTKYLTITNKETGAAIFERTVISGGSATGGLGNMQFVTSRYWANFAIDNIVVREVAEGDVPSTPIYTITTKYVDGNGNSIRADKTDSIQEGQSFTPEYANTFDDDNNRYTYVSGAEEIPSVNADRVITIVYSSAPLAEHTVTFSTTGYVSTLGTFTVKDAKSYTYAYPRYIPVGNDLYQIVKDRYDQGFQKTVSNVTEDTNPTEEYTKKDGYYVYYAEAEDVLTKSSTNNNIPVRCSCGNAGYPAEDTVITTLPAGTYRMSAAVFGNAGTSFVFKAGEETVLTATTLGYAAEVNGAEFTLTDDTAITLLAAGNSGTSPKVVDYIYIEKLDLASDPTATVTGIKSFAGDNGEDDVVSLWRVDITYNGIPITSVGVSVPEADVQTKSVGEITGDAIFGILVNKVAPISVYLNGSATAAAVAESTPEYAE